MDAPRRPFRYRIILAVVAATVIAIVLVWKGGTAGAAGASAIGSSIIILATRIVEKDD